MDVRFLQNHRFLSTLAACAVSFMGLGSLEVGAQQKLPAEEVTQIAKDGYAFLYPMVLMDTARQQMVSEDPDTKESGKAPYNRFVHARLYAPPSFRGFVRPNLDTLYSSAWVDLRHGPVILTVPPLASRYAVVQVLDLWAEIVANMNRKTGVQAGGKFAIVPQGWKGELPEGVETITCSGDRAWVVVRLAANGPQDIKDVNALQDQFQLDFLTPPPPPEVKAEEVDAEEAKPTQSRTRQRRSRTSQTTAKSNEPRPQIQGGATRAVDALSPEKFFSAASTLLAQHPAPTGRWTTLAMLKQIGVRPGHPYEINGLESGYYGATSRGVEQAKAEMKKTVENLVRLENGWATRNESLDLVGRGDLVKAAMVSLGVGTPLPEDLTSYQTTTTDTESRLVGANKYVLTFSKDQLPPTHAFWTLSLYDQDGFPVKNTMDRYGLGSNDKLTYDADGSLTLYLQPKSPYGEKENNWLPSPKWGYYSIMLRIYNPSGEALSQTWKIPAVTRPLSKEALLKKKAESEAAAALTEPPPAEDSASAN